MDLNTSAWSPYKISDLFFTYTGGDLIIEDIQEGDIPVISHTSKTNGVCVYSSEIDGRKLFDCEKTISLADRGTFFAAVQFKNFYIGTRVKALEFIDGKHSVEVRQFIVTVINFEQFRFCYGRNCTNGLDELIIKLPTKGTAPDYEFMEKYIRSLNINISNIPDYFLNEGYNKACWYIDNIDVDSFENKYSGKYCADTMINLQEKRWGEFRLGDNTYFKIERGDSVYLKNLSSGDVPYVSTTSENNGICAYVSDANRDGNLITLAYDGTIGACFYQESPFFASEKIVTIDTVQYRLNGYLAIFIIQILKLESELFSYGGRKWTVEKQLKNTVIKLPINSDGQPDYRFMEDYIKSLPFSKNIE